MCSAAQLGQSRYYGDQVALYWSRTTVGASAQSHSHLGVRYEYTTIPFGERAQSLNQAASVPGLIDFSERGLQEQLGSRIGIAYNPLLSETLGALPIGLISNADARTPIVLGSLGSLEVYKPGDAGRLVQACARSPNGIVVYLAHTQIESEIWADAPTVVREQ